MTSTEDANRLASALEETARTIVDTETQEGQQLLEAAAALRELVEQVERLEANWKSMTKLDAEKAAAEAERDDFRSRWEELWNKANESVRQVMARAEAAEARLKAVEDQVERRLRAALEQIVDYFDLSFGKYQDKWRTDEYPLPRDIAATALSAEEARQ